MNLQIDGGKLGGCAIAQAIQFKAIVQPQTTLTPEDRTTKELLILNLDAELLCRW